MSKISQPGYLFMHSGVLTNIQIEKCLKDAAISLSENFEPGFENTEIEIKWINNKFLKKLSAFYS